MTFIHNVNIVGGRYANPAVLKTRLEPMKLEENMGITAKFIAFGEVADINGQDCVFYVRDFGKNVMLKIKEGRYGTREEVLLAICHIINKYIKNKMNSLSTTLGPRCSTTTSAGKFVLTPPRGIDLMLNDRTNKIWRLIKAYETENNNIKQATVYTGDLEERTGMAFIYINIVENSYINGQKSRVLTAFPVSSKSGYTYHEFTNTTYIPIEVKEFSEIEIELRDIKGELLSIDDSYDTIVSLHISPINRGKSRR